MLLHGLYSNTRIGDSNIDVFDSPGFDDDCVCVCVAWLVYALCVCMCCVLCVCVCVCVCVCCMECVCNLYVCVYVTGHTRLQSPPDGHQGRSVCQDYSLLQTSWCWNYWHSCLRVEGIISVASELLFVCFSFVFIISLPWYNSPGWLYVKTKLLPYLLYFYFIFPYCICCMHILCHFSSDIFCVIFKITCFVSFLKLYDILYNFAAVKGIVRPHMLRSVQGSARMLLILGMWKLDSCRQGAGCCVSIELCNCVMHHARLKRCNLSPPTGPGMQVWNW